MNSESNLSAILVTSHPGQLSCAELERLAAAGERPRKDYVELARLLDADVIDSHYMAERAVPLARALAQRAGLPAGQVAEAFLRRARYRHIVAWADRLGLPLALLYKLARSRRDLVLVSVLLSSPHKAVFLQPLRVHTHLRAIVNYGSVQLQIAATRLGVPRHKLHLALQPVDDRFWRPISGRTENLICAVGWEARDYGTLLKAARGLDLAVELAVGSTIDGLASGATTDRVTTRIRELVGEGLPPNVRVNGCNLQELRMLYARSRFVVIPLQDVDFDAGVTATTEAMAMGKAVVISRTRGQVDLIRDGEQGIYVPPGDPAALRTAITYLANHPEETERMGRAGRALVEERHTLDAYVAGLAAVVRGTDEFVADIPTPGRAGARARGPDGAAVPHEHGA